MWGHKEARVLRVVSKRKHTLLILIPLAASLPLSRIADLSVEEDL